MYTRVCVKNVNLKFAEISSADQMPMSTSCLQTIAIQNYI